MTEIKKKTERKQNRNLIPFKKGQKPPATPQQKKDGRQRKKEALKLMSDIMSKSDMTIEDFLEKYMDPIKNSKGEIVTHKPKISFTVREAFSIKYCYHMLMNMVSLDWMDRHVSKAPQQMQFGGPEEEGSKEITIKIV